MTEPTTAAGRGLLDRINRDIRNEEQEQPFSLLDAVLAIEAEARAEERERAARIVETHIPRVQIPRVQRERIGLARFSCTGCRWAADFADHRTHLAALIREETP